MNDIPSRNIKTGSDPRSLPDYSALRDELSKLTHPARPDVDWHYAEKLCLSLFGQNGVELQTAAWYTLARTQLAGLHGLNEGLAILEALISHQWGGLWPQPVHARMEILSALSQRLQQRMRTLTLSYGDLSQLYRAEQLLTRLGAVLQRLELKHLSQLDTLRTQMHNAAVRLENSDGASDAGVGVALPATVISDTSDETCNAVQWVYVAQPEYQPTVEVLAAMPAPHRKWRYFGAGICTMLAIGVVAVAGRQYLHRPDPLQAQLVASLAPLPAILTPAQREALQQQKPLPQPLIADTQRQLARLDKLPPDWNITYGRQLIEQAQALWPEQTQPLLRQWQLQLNASALPTENLEGWHRGMMQLKQLSDRLNGLDEQKGKYMTVSELKSVVFTATQFFNQAVPAEEQLRLLSHSPEGQPLPPAARSQMDMHLRQLIASYAAIKQHAQDN